MKLESSILYAVISLTLFLSCNSDEKRFKEFNARIENIALLSESLKSNENDYLKSLIDSIKIIKNEYSILKLDSTFENKLQQKVNLTTSLLKRKISNNCILNRTFEMEIDGFDDFPQFLYGKIRLDFYILKDNKCVITLYTNNQKFEWDYFYSSPPEFKSSHEEDMYLLKFLNETRWVNTQNEHEKVILNYETYDDSTFRINIPNYPIFLKVKDFMDCESELIRTKYSKSRKMKKNIQTFQDINNKIEKYKKSINTEPVYDNRPVIKY